MTFNIAHDDVIIVNEILTEDPLVHIYEAEKSCIVFQNELRAIVRATITFDKPSNSATLQYKLSLKDPTQRTDWQFNLECRMFPRRHKVVFPTVSGILTDEIPPQTIEVPSELNAAELLQEENPVLVRLRVSPLGANLLDELLVIRPTEIQNRHQGNEAFVLSVYASGDSMYSRDLDDLLRSVEPPKENARRKQRVAELSLSHETLFKEFFRLADGRTLIFLNLDGREPDEMVEAKLRSNFESGMLTSAAAGRPFQYHFLPLLDYNNGNDLEIGKTLVQMAKTWGSDAYVVMHCSAGQGRSGFAVTVIEGAVSPATADAAARAQECWKTMTHDAQELFTKLQRMDTTNCVENMYELMSKNKTAALELYKKSGTNDNKKNTELKTLFRPNHSVMALLQSSGGAAAPHVVL